MTKPLSAVELIRNFDRLSEDAVVPIKVVCILLNLSEWTLRRDPLPIRRIQLSAKRFGYRVGDVRAFSRGTK